MTHLPDSDLRELEGRLETTAAAILAGGSIKFYAKPGLATDIRALIADLREARERIDAMSAVGIRQEAELAQARARIKELEGKT